MKDSLDIEIWKDIPNFEGRYMASNMGRIKSLVRMVKSKYKERTVPEKILKLNNFRGYLKVQLGSNSKDFRVHRIIADVFIPKEIGKIYVNHINGNKSDNRVSNLEWCTAKENTSHAIESRNGRFKANVKLSDLQILTILSMTNFSHKEMADHYSVSKGIISQTRRLVLYKPNTKFMEKPFSYIKAKQKFKLDGEK